MFKALLFCYRLAGVLLQILTAETDIIIINIFVKPGSNLGKVYITEKHFEIILNEIQLLNSNQSSTSANESDFLQFDDAKESSRSRYQLVSRQQVLQLLARRCLELGRSVFRVFLDQNLSCPAVFTKKYLVLLLFLGFHLVSSTVPHFGL